MNNLADTFNNWDRVNTFFEKQSILNVIKVEIQNVNVISNEETELLKTSLQRTSRRRPFRGNCHRALPEGLTHTSRRERQKGTPPDRLCEVSKTLVPKLDKDIYYKNSIYTNISHKRICKNHNKINQIQQNVTRVTHTYIVNRFFS